MRLLHATAAIAAGLALRGGVPAQDAKPSDSVPAPTNVRGAEFPRVHADLRVTFRIKAPQAQKVEFAFYGPPQRYAGQKDKDGFWTATTEPLVPGFHYY